MASPDAKEGHSNDVSFRRTLLGLALAGLLIRLAFLVLEPATRPVADERTWINWGIEAPEGIASARVRFLPLRTSMVFHPPLYPYLIALTHLLFGTLTALKCVQAALGTLLVPAVGLLGRRLFGVRTGLVAAGLASFYPELVWYSVHFWSEPLFMALLWWAFERVLAAGTGGSRGAALAAGLLWGATVLTRETALYFAPVVAVWMVWKSPGGLGRAAVFLLSLTAIVAPWTWRNWVLYRAFVPVSTMGGLNLWQGNGRMTRDEVYAEYEQVQGRIEQYRYARQKAVDAILRRQPAWLFQKVWEQTPRFWEIDTLPLLHIQKGAYGDVSPTAARLAAVVVSVPYLALLAFLCPGLALLLIDRPRVLLLAFLAYYLLLHWVTYGYSRFRVPILPVLFLLAASAWVAVREPSPRPVFTPGRKAVAWGLAVLLAAALLPSFRRTLSHPAYDLVEGATAPVDEDRP